MALLVKSNGEAVVEEPKTTAAEQNTGNVAAATPTATQTKTESATVPNNATAGLDYKTIQSGLSATYESKYDDQLADLYNQITQRKPFTYNADDDMLYQQYVQKYTQQGKQAMKDTMGQAAALTGGYGSSYGQAVGQQAYNAYLQQLNNILPQMYDRAYQQYADEGNRRAQQYSLLSDIENKDYTRWNNNYQLNADNYDRYMQQAALAGAAGDFSAYKDIVGEEGVSKMQQLFNAQTLMPLYQNGYISAEDYKAITGAYPVGYSEGGVSSGGGGDWYGNNNGGDTVWISGDYDDYGTGREVQIYGGQAEVDRALDYYAAHGVFPEDYRK